MNYPVFKKSICQWPYYLRGKGGKYRKWAIKKKTDFGLWLIRCGYVGGSGNRKNFAPFERRHLFLSEQHFKKGK